MSGESAKQNSPQWLVYTRLSQFRYGEQNWFADRTFTTFEDAEAFLQGPSHDWPDSAKRSQDGWLGPIKSQALSVCGQSFTGPWLPNTLKISTSDKTETYDQTFEAWWESTGADVVPYVMVKMDSEGLLAKTYDVFGNPVYTQGQKKEVQLRADKYKLPEIECSLDASWNFFEIEMNARRRLGHVNSDETVGFERRLFAAALDLEDVLRAQFARLAAIDVYHFWTSLQVWVHLAGFCRKTLWGNQANQRDIEMARQRFCRALGSYAHTVRNGWQHGEDGMVTQAAAKDRAIVADSNCKMDDSNLVSTHDPSCTPDLAPPPRRGPDFKSSRERLNLAAMLRSELATVKQDLNGFCTAEMLKKRHPNFTLWDHIHEVELKELVDGTEFTPRAYAENLVLRRFGITSRETLKKDRKKLRRALRSA